MNAVPLAPLVLLSCIALAPPPASAATTQQVHFVTEDGVSIAATLYLPSRPGPAVVLIHMQTRSRQDWEAVGTRLADAGLVALAIDLRGHGGSGPRPTGPNARDGGIVADLRAARAYLATRREATPGRVGLLGASIGANLAVVSASADSTVRSLALLSPGLDYQGLRTQANLNRYGGRPALLVGSREDSYVMMTLQRLSTEGAGIREQLVFDGAGHGTTMLARQPELVGVLVDWFKRTLL